MHACARSSGARMWLGRGRKPSHLGMGRQHGPGAEPVASPAGFASGRGLCFGLGWGSRLAGAPRPEGQTHA
jgi:hypothetical protein